MSNRKVGFAMTVSTAFLISVSAAFTGSALSGHFGMSRFIVLCLLSFLFLFFLDILLNKLLHSEFAMARIADAFMLTIGAKTKANVRTDTENAEKGAFYHLCVSFISAIIHGPFLILLMLLVAAIMATASMNNAVANLEQQLSTTQSSLTTIEEVYNQMEESDEKRMMESKMTELERTISGMSQDLTELQEQAKLPMASLGKRAVTTGVPVFLLTWLILFLTEPVLMKIFTKKYGQIESDFNK